MKRGTFKRKIGKPMKRTKLRKKGVQNISKVQRELWELCKQIVRKRYVNKDGTWYCFTCDRLIDEPHKAQTGHGIPKASLGAYLKYDLRLLRIQDYYCNINLGGNGAEFYRRLVKEMGQEEVDQIYRDKNITVKALDHYLKLIEEYKLLLNQLK